MSHLIRLVALRHLTASPGRTFLTLFGVVLGVALMFAIDLVNDSVMASFRKNIDQMAGKTELVVGEGAGVDEALLEVVRGVEGVAVAAPVIEESVRDVKTGAQLAVLAVDSISDGQVRDYDVSAGDVQIEDDLAFLNDPHGVLLSTRYAKERGLKSGDGITLETVQGPREFTVRGTLAPSGPAKLFGGDLLLMDVFAAQIAFERGKRFDHIDVVPNEGADTTALAARIRSAIGERASVIRPQRRAQDAEQILAGFRLGLSIASLVAMLVAGFIVYNALAIAVAQRRREIGTLRALGATRRQVLGLFVGEALLIGAFGSVFGALLGTALGRLSLRAVGAAVSELYLPVQASEFALSPSQLAHAMVVGMGVSLVAALLPALRASTLEPASVMRKKSDTPGVSLVSMRGSLAASAGMFVLALAVGYAAHVREDFRLGSSVAIFLALATAFLSPVLARGISALARRIISRRAAATRLGVLGFERNTGRNAIAIAALSMALANVVNIGCFLESIKGNTVRWFERTLRADILIFAGRRVQGKYVRPLPAALEQELAALPGVEFINPLRMTKQSYRDRAFYLFAYDLANYVKYDEVPVVDGDLSDALREISAGVGLAASETFAKEFGVALGDTVRLQTPEGPREFRISLVYVDYSAELGILTTTREVYTRIWKDTLIDSFGLYLADGTPAEPLRARIARDIGKQRELMVLSNASYKAEVLQVFDRSFALMRAMELVAIIVALLGIVNTLVVSVIDRTAELGILKAIGAVSGQVKKMFVTEALLIGAAAAVLGLGGGLLFSVYTVKELLRFQMGWQIAWQGSPAAAAETVVMALLVAAVGAWFPMRSAAKLDVVEALAYE